MITHLLTTNLSFSLCSKSLNISLNKAETLQTEFCSPPQIILLSHLLGCLK